MSFASEFKQFALKGSVVDLAIGVIIGAAFGKIVDSAVSDLIMPILAMALGQVDFTNLFVALREIPAGVPATLDAVRKAGVPVFAWGQFLTVGLNFLILAFVIFIMVRQINRVRRAEEPPPAPTREDVLLLREIRDCLKK